MIQEDLGAHFGNVGIELPTLRAKNALRIGHPLLGRVREVGLMRRVGSPVQ